MAQGRLGATGLTRLAVSGASGGLTAAGLRDESLQSLLTVGGCGLPVGRLLFDLLIDTLRYWARIIVSTAEWSDRVPRFQQSGKLKFFDWILFCLTWSSTSSDTFTSDMYSSISWSALSLGRTSRRKSAGKGVGRSKTGWLGGAGVLGGVDGSEMLGLGQVGADVGFFLPARLPAPPPLEEAPLRFRLRPRDGRSTGSPALPPPMRHRWKALSSSVSSSSSSPPHASASSSPGSCANEWEEADVTQLIGNSF